MPSLKPYRSRAKILADHAAFEIGMNKVRAKIRVCKSAPQNK
jgi:hypothetical protein